MQDTISAAIDELEAIAAEEEFDAALVVQVHHCCDSQKT